MGGRIVGFENLNQKLMSVFGNLPIPTGLLLALNRIIFNIVIYNYLMTNLHLFSFKTRK